MAGPECKGPTSRNDEVGFLTQLPKPAATPFYPKLEKAEHGRANLDELIRASNLNGLGQRVLS